MKKYISSTVVGLIVLLSIILLSACIELPFNSVIEKINPSQRLDEEHYLNDPDINNPDYYYQDILLNNSNDYNNDGTDEVDDVQTTLPEPTQPEDNIDEQTESQPVIKIDKNLKQGKDTLLKVLVNLTIRSAPSAASSSLGSIIPGALLPYIEQTNDSWYQTTYKGKKAYVSTKYTDIFFLDKASPVIEKIIEQAETLLGYPYVYGAQRYHWGNGKLNLNFVMGKFDCSSLTQYAYYKGANILLDLTTRTQVLQGQSVKKENLRRGDLMFFTNSSRRNLTGTERVGHVAIFLGNNYILHTASTYAIIEPISSRRWNDYITSRRFI